MFKSLKLFLKTDLKKKREPPAKLPFFGILPEKWDHPGAHTSIIPNSEKEQSASFTWKSFPQLKFDHFLLTKIAPTGHSFNLI